MSGMNGAERVLKESIDEVVDGYRPTGDPFARVETAVRRRRRRNRAVVGASLAAVAATSIAVVVALPGGGGQASERPAASSIESPGVVLPGYEPVPGKVYRVARGTHAGVEWQVGSAGGRTGQACLVSRSVLIGIAACFPTGDAAVHWAAASSSNGGRRPTSRSRSSGSPRRVRHGSRWCSPAVRDRRRRPSRPRPRRTRGSSPYSSRRASVSRFRCRPSTPRAAPWGHPWRPTESSSSRTVRRRGAGPAASTLRTARTRPPPPVRTRTSFPALRAERRLRLWVGRSRPRRRRSLRVRLGEGEASPTVRWMRHARYDASLRTAIRCGTAAGSPDRAPAAQRALPRLRSASLPSNIKVVSSMRRKRPSGAMEANT